MARGEHIREVLGKIENQNTKAFDFPVPEELIQKP
jgi:hypothetical protein